MAIAVDTSLRYATLTKILISEEFDSFCKRLIKELTDSESYIGIEYENMNSVFNLENSNAILSVAEDTIVFTPTKDQDDIPMFIITTNAVAPQSYRQLTALIKKLYSKSADSMFAGMLSVLPELGDE